MKSRSLMKPKSLLIACCAATALAFLIGVVDEAYAARAGGGGYSRGGAASGGSFSPGAPGQGRVGDGVVGRPGVYYGTVVVLPCSPTAISVDGFVYYICDTAYFTPGYYPDGSVVYVQVEPPPGY